MQKPIRIFTDVEMDTYSLYGFTMSFFSPFFGLWSLIISFPAIHLALLLHK